jgi:mannan endo-1,4-beta-mannosidase
VQLVASNATAVEQGDVLLASFFLRTETPHDGSVGETEFVFELGRPPYAKSVQYPVQGPPEWTRVQARFKATRAYAPGEAHLIFRLGYDPEVVQIGGVTVENFGKSLAIGALPSTQSADRGRERAAAAAVKAVSAVPANPTDGGELEIAVDTKHVIRPISPYVYGVNAQAAEGAGVTVRRSGGNRGTGYNWENNASNAGNDYNHQSDEWSCAVLGFRDCDAPAAMFIDFARANRDLKAESVVTVPMVDYVAADKSGPVRENDKAPSKRWVRSYAQKPGPFAATPDLSDGTVYQDEMVNYLVGKLGRANDKKGGGIKFYSLDNEPALWPSTHPRLHPDATSYDEMVKRTEATALAIAKVDPGAFILGGVMYGWGEYMSLGDAPDAKPNNATYGTYLDFFLASMKAVEDRHHKRLVHALDVHWYPEAKGAKRITDKDLSPQTVAARLQAPRSLWDPSYSEKSWIAATWGKPIRLIPWLRERIDERYPGTKLAMTEYDYGGSDHISGALAQADVLGVLGREGVYLATYWGNGPGNGPLAPFIKAAFQLYRNYDGAGATYGDTAVEATPSDLGKLSAFAATSTRRPGVLTVLVINKDLGAAYDAKIDVMSGGKSDGKLAKAQVYMLTGQEAAVRPGPTVDIKGGQLRYRVAPLSATLFVCK